MDPSEELWNRILACNDWSEAGKLFAQLTSRPVELIRSKFRGSGNDCFTALGLVSYLETSQRMELFDDLLHFCRSQKFGLAARRMVLQLPREWVLANIERVAEPIIQYADHLDYSMFLLLYGELDRELALKLAKRAAQSDDYDTAEVGNEYLESIARES